MAQAMGGRPTRHVAPEGRKITRDDWLCVQPHITQLATRNSELNDDSQSAAGIPAQKLRHMTLRHRWEVPRAKAGEGCGRRVSFSEATKRSTGFQPVPSDAPLSTGWKPVLRLIMKSAAAHVRERLAIFERLGGRYFGDHQLVVSAKFAK